MPKLTIEKVRPLITQLRAGNFSNLGAGPIRVRADRFYQKAIDGKLTGQDRVDAYDLYRLSLQLERSNDPRALLALDGFELERTADGYFYARAFEVAPVDRMDFLNRVNEKDPNSEIVMRGMDWTVEIKVAKEKLLEELAKISYAMKDVPGVTLQVPENIEDSNTLRIYANHDTIKRLAAELSGRAVDFQAEKYVQVANGKYLWKLQIGPRGIEFGESPYLSGAGKELVNVDHGKDSYAANWAILTDVGTRIYRERNEDSAGHAVLDVDREVWLVGDGMGGHASGDVASKAGVEAFLTAMKNGKILIEAVQEANQAVIKVNQEAVARGEKGGAGTTMVALLIDRNAKIGQIAWVGDSRARFVDENAEGLLTIDHSFQYSVIKGEMQTEGKSMELPLTLDKLADIDNRIENAGDMVRSHGNVISSVLGHQGSPPVIGLVEFALGDGAKPAKIALYSDGAIDGPANKTAAEKAIIEIVRQGHSPDLIVDKLLAQAYSAGTADNVTVALVSVPEGLSLAELKEISGEKFQQALIARLNDVNYQMTMGELKYMVEVYLLNPSIVPAELIERTKQKVLVSKNADATELMRKIDPSIPPVPKVIVPPPLPANPPPVPVTDDSPTNPNADPTREVSDSMVVKPGLQELFVSFSHKGKVNSARLIYDGNWGQLNKDAEGQMIAAAFRQTKGKDKSTIYLSHSFMEYLMVLKNQGTQEEHDHFYQTIRNAVTARGWMLTRDRIFIYLNPSNLSITVYEENELTEDLRKVHFPAFQQTT